MSWNKPWAYGIAACGRDLATVFKSTISTPDVARAERRVPEGIGFIPNLSRDCFERRGAGGRIHLKQPKLSSFAR